MKVANKHINILSGGCMNKHDEYIKLQRKHEKKWGH